MSPSNFAVPASETEVTKEWLQAALAGSFPNATFESLASERIGESYGFASRIFRYKWQDKGTSQSVVMKLWNTDSKAGLGEIRFYQTFKDIGTRIPICYHSATDAETKMAVLLLEDLRDASQGDVLEHLDLDRAKGVAHSLARLHGTWLEHPKLAELSWVSDASAWTREEGWYQSRRTLFLERFPDRLDGLARILLEKIELGPRVANERLAKAPITLLHGDFHLDNFLFDKQTEPVMLDWSRLLKGPQVYNLANLLFGMSPLQNFDTLFGFYLEEFNKCAETSLSGEVIERQLGGMLLQKFEQSTCGIALWQPSLPRAVEMIDEGIENAITVVEFWQERDPELFSFLR
jgi:streptomycin 6-kinase